MLIVQLPYDYLRLLEPGARVRRRARDAGGRRVRRPRPWAGER
ncbi:MAG TPA: hypothetical protein VNI83_16135 [Vicinamibacterales bacterium]|nr:hypothetical protein [Vicinamibacterales bacterium]